jgi:hypothetical protein
MDLAHGRLLQDVGVDDVADFSGKKRSDGCCEGADVDALKPLRCRHVLGRRLINTKGRHGSVDPAVGEWPGLLRHFSRLVRVTV